MAQTVAAPNAGLTTPDASLHRRVNQLVCHEGDEGAFLRAMLETQCAIAPAVAAALIRIDRSSAARVLSVHPDARPGDATRAWIVRSLAQAPAVIKAGQPFVQHLDAVTELDDSVVNPHLVILPLGPDRGTSVAAAYVVDAGSELALERARERLLLTGGLLGLHGTRRKLRSRDQVIERLRAAMELLEAVNEQDRFKAAAMALCNEVAAGWRADRVAIGFLDGRQVRAAAISHTERFDRRMQLVQDLEAAMEECIDQDVEIVHPRLESAIYVSRAAERLGQRHGPAGVMEIPLRRHGDTVGVLSVERSLDEPFEVAEIEGLRLVGDLVAPRLLELRRHDRWIGARAVIAARESLAGVVGPKYTLQKLIVIVTIIAVAFLTFVRGTDHVDASFSISAVEHRAVAAPFDARLDEIAVATGDRVVAGVTVLATLETADLRLELAAAEAERAGYLKEADLALRDGRTVEVKIAEANLRRADAEIELLRKRLDETTILAPVDGVVVSADLKKMIGAPVETGDVLFEIASLESMRAELEVPEDRIVDLVGEEGRWLRRHGVLASVSYPGDYITFEVERVNPVAEVIDQKNVFRVRVRLLEERAWLRPGMQGIAKVQVGRRPYGVLWTRRFVNWARMRLWV